MQQSESYQKKDQLETIIRYENNSTTISEPFIEKNNSLLKKHLRPEEEINKYNENQPFKEKKIDDTITGKTKINDLSFTQIKRKKSIIEKEIEEKKKKLKELEMKEQSKKSSIKNEFNKEKEKNLSYVKNSSNIKINDNNGDNKVDFNPFSKSLNIKNSKNSNYISKENRRFEEYNSQILNNSNNNIANSIEKSNIINLNENEEINNKVYENPSNKGSYMAKMKIIEEKNLLPNNIKENKISESTGNKNNNNTQSIKSKKSLINKEEISYINDIDSQKKELNYSFRCLSQYLNFMIQKGIKELKTSIEFENNGELPWPNNQTTLESDPKSKIKIEKVVLKPLNQGSKCKIDLVFKNMNKLEPGYYYSYLVFKIDNIKYGNTLLVTVVVTENYNKIKYKPLIKPFRDYSGINKSIASDTIIVNLIDQYKNFEEPIECIFENNN